MVPAMKTSCAAWMSRKPAAPGYPPVVARVADFVEDSFRGVLSPPVEEMSHSRCLPLVNSYLLTNGKLVKEFLKWRHKAA